MHKKQTIDNSNKAMEFPGMHTYYKKRKTYKTLFETEKYFSNK